MRRLSCYAPLLARCALPRAQQLLNLYARAPVATSASEGSQILHTEPCAQPASLPSLAQCPLPQSEKKEGRRLAKTNIIWQGMECRLADTTCKHCDKYVLLPI